MRAIIISCMFLGGCGLVEQTIDEYTPPSYVQEHYVYVNRDNTSGQNLLSAYRFINYSEQTHRAELKEFIGVDPVRTEWCAAFVNAVLNESGIAGSESVSQYPLTARSFLEWGEEVDEPKPGDLVVFPRGNQGWQGHVGFYLGTSLINGETFYQILGGNQSNKVSIELYPARSKLGIRRQLT